MIHRRRDLLKAIACTPIAWVPSARAAGPVILSLDASVSPDYLLVKASIMVSSVTTVVILASKSGLSLKRALAIFNGGPLPADVAAYGYRTLNSSNTVQAMVPTHGEECFYAVVAQSGAAAARLASWEVSGMPGAPPALLQCNADVSPGLAHLSATFETSYEGCTSYFIYSTQPDPSFPPSSSLVMAGQVSSTDGSSNLVFSSVSPLPAWGAWKSALDLAGLAPRTYYFKHILQGGPAPVSSPMLSFTIPG